MARITEEAQALLEQVDVKDATVVAPPGKPAELQIRSLTRDDGNINNTVAPAPVAMIHVCQHEFAPLVRVVDDEGWRLLARDDGGINWRIIRQYPA